MSSRIEIKLSNLIKKSGLSKNKLCHKAEIQFSQIKAWENNDITRCDIDVLRRLCDVFSDIDPDFKITDLIDYVKEDKKTM